MIGAAFVRGDNERGAIHEPGGDVAARRVVNDCRQIKLLQLAFEKELVMTPTTRGLLQNNKAGELTCCNDSRCCQTVDRAEPSVPP